MVPEPENERSDTGSDQDIFNNGDVIADVDLSDTQHWPTIQWRLNAKKRQRHESVSDIPKITAFFQWQEEPNSDQIPKRTEAMHTIQDAIHLLNENVRMTLNIIVERRTQGITKWNLCRFLAVRRYLQCLLRNEPKVQSSE